MYLYLTLNKQFYRKCRRLSTYIESRIENVYKVRLSIEWQKNGRFRLWSNTSTRNMSFKFFDFLFLLIVVIVTSLAAESGKFYLKCLQPSQIHLLQHYNIIFCQKKQENACQVKVTMMDAITVFAVILKPFSVL